MDEVPVDIAIKQMTYLPISEVNNICVLNKKYHSYCTDPKYNSRWKLLIDNTYSSIDNYQEKLNEIWNKLGLPPNTYNYKVYTHLIHTLDKITQSMIYYKQGDHQSFDKLSQTEKFLSMFMLGNKDLINYLPNHYYQPFVDMLNGKSIPEDTLNKMLLEMTFHDNLAGVKYFKTRGSTLSDQEILMKIFNRKSMVDSTNVLNYLNNRGADIYYAFEYPLMPPLIGVI